MALMTGLQVTAYTMDTLTKLGLIKLSRLRIHNNSEEGAGGAVKAKTPVPLTYNWSLDGEIFVDSGAAADVVAKAISASAKIALVWTVAGITFTGTLTLNKCKHNFLGPRVQSVEFSGVCAGALS